MGEPARHPGPSSLCSFFFLPDHLWLGQSGSSRKERDGSECEERAEKRQALRRWAGADVPQLSVFIQESGSPPPCLPTHRTPLGWGLSFTCPSWSRPHGHSDQEPLSLWADSTLPTTLRGRQISSESCPLWDTVVRGRRGPGVQFLVSWTPQLFPSRGPSARQNFKFEGWGQDGGHSSSTATSSPGKTVGTFADTPGL